MPIGAILVSPEITEVIHSQSNKLGITVHFHSFNTSSLGLIFLTHVCLF